MQAGAWAVGGGGREAAVRGVPFGEGAGVAGASEEGEEMTHIIQLSGGKDSTALVLWAKERR